MEDIKLCRILSINETAQLVLDFSMYAEQSLSIYMLAGFCCMFTFNKDMFDCLTKNGCCIGNTIVVK